MTIFKYGGIGLIAGAVGVAFHGHHDKWSVSFCSNKSGRIGKVNRTLAVIALAVVSSFAVPAQNRGSDKNVEQQIKKLEQSRFEAYLHLDAKALDRLTADDYTSIDANGEIVNKVELPSDK